MPRLSLDSLPPCSLWQREMGVRALLTGSGHDLPAAHRCAAMVLALLWLASPVLALLHAQAEIHRYCAQHGTLEEAGAPEPASPRSDRPVAAGLPTAESPHDGCAFAPHYRFSQILVSFTLEPGGDLPPRRSPGGRPTGWGSPLPLLLLAPKTSPPA